MLHLKSESTARWLHQVDAHLDEVLIDHAHCERKAASTAMNLILHAGLFESEARHHTTYVRLAESFADREDVRARLDQLSAKESEIIAIGSDLPRMHS